MAATGSEVIYQGAFGKRDLGKPRRDDARQRVLDRLDDQGDHRARPAMQLVEQGKLALDAPIGKLLPDLADTAGVRRLRRQRQAEAARRQARRSRSSI